MKVGITLPQFRDEADSALEAARRAEELGLDGVFCFDHLWPMGQPGPSRALARPRCSVRWPPPPPPSRVGTLVARVGLVPDEVLVAVLSSLAAISGGRMIAGIGTGDHLSRPENEAFGVPFEPAAERRARLAVGGRRGAGPGHPGLGRRGAAQDRRAGPDRSAVAVNLWEGEPLRVAELTAAGHEVTWGGPVGATVPEAAARLGELAAAGATWAVCAWPESLEVVAEAAERSGTPLTGPAVRRPDGRGAA